MTTPSRSAFAVLPIPILILAGCAGPDRVPGVEPEVMDVEMAFRGSGGRLPNVRIELNREAFVYLFMITRRGELLLLNQSSTPEDGPYSPGGHLLPSNEIYGTTHPAIRIEPRPRPGRDHYASGPSETFLVVAIATPIDVMRLTHTSTGCELDAPSHEARLALLLGCLVLEPATEWASATVER